MSEGNQISQLRGAIAAAASELRADASEGAQPTMERPPKAELGDYSTNAAMLLAAPLRENPRDVAERLRDELLRNNSLEIERVEVAGPGFVNLFLSDAWFRRAIGDLFAAGDDLGLGEVESPEKVIVEFVSANPTGPLTAAGGRHAAYGDAVSRLLEAVGHDVGREYYVNDGGGQVQRFAASLAARMTDAELPEDGYEGEYVTELAERLKGEGLDPTDMDAVSRRGTELMVESIRGTLDRYRAEFDVWFSERSLEKAGKVEKALERLRRAGHTYESDGALWLRSSDFGDDKDRVLVRANGESTYLAPDIAYHADKLERGFERLIDVLGADHHGYVARMRAAIEALGASPDAFEAKIMQLVHIVEGGGRAQMSKRRGEFVSLDELVDDIGVDATRFFMLQRSHDTPVDLDLDLARRESSENPVYYVQYAHARIASILRKASQESDTTTEDFDPAAEASALQPAERTLIKRLLELPNEVEEAAERRAPHRLCAYAMTVAADFHGFYRDCQVVGAEGPGVEQTRLVICQEVKRTIAQTLGLLGISAPERM